MSTARYLPSYTVEDYHQWEGDWELWQGIPVAMTPSPFGTHQRCAMLVAFALESAIRENECAAVVLQETDWIVDQSTVLRPDVVLLCDGVPDGHIEKPPAFVCEVLSPSTRTRDLGSKRELYAEVAVEHYLVVDPKSSEVFYSRSGSELQPLVDDKLHITVCDDCKLAVDLSKLQV